MNDVPSSCRQGSRRAGSHTCRTYACRSTGAQAGAHNPSAPTCVKARPCRSCRPSAITARPETIRSHGCRCGTLCGNSRNLTHRQYGRHCLARAASGTHRQHVEAACQVHRGQRHQFNRLAGHFMMRVYVAHRIHGEHSQVQQQTAKGVARRPCDQSTYVRCSSNTTWGRSRASTCCAPCNAPARHPQYPAGSGRCGAPWRWA